MGRIKRFIIFLSFVIAYFYFILLVATFLAAYGSETKQVIVDINSFGEANFEYILFTILVAITTVGFYYFFEWLDERLQ